MVDVRPLLLAVDIGGTKLAAGLVSSAGVLMETVSCPTPAGTDAETLFGVLVGLVDEVRNDAFDRLVEIDDSLGRPEVCGVGVGGPMGSQGEWVSPLNITAWRRFPLRQRLADHLGLPIYVDNDAKALALGEAWVGAASETENFIAMVVSTGVGGGIVLDGRLASLASRLSSSVHSLLPEHACHVLPSVFFSVFVGKSGGFAFGPKRSTSVAAEAAPTRDT